MSAPLKYSSEYICLSHFVIIMQCSVCGNHSEMKCFRLNENKTDNEEEYGCFL